MHFLIWAGLTAAGAILYRMGGSDTYDTKWRDFGTALCNVAMLWYFTPAGYHIWPLSIALCLTFGCMFGSLTSYFKRKGSDALWYNWVIVGVVNGLAAFPYIILTQNWEGFVCRIIFLAFSVTLWSSHVENAVWEECGRGALITGSCILLV